ncbi:MAG: DNA double-strand break repair nuclease NurA [Gallicola sp.]|nr:DNA double-strand break repair nuclease NurA [Gallicola sp.]
MEKKIIEEIQKLNDALEDYYKEFSKMSKSDWRGLLDQIGVRYKVEEMEKRSLREIACKGGILCTDASSNHYGGAYPHFATLFRGVSISTEDETSFHTLSDVFIPLLDQPLASNTEESRKKEEAKLAAIEIQVTLEALKEKKPAVLLMDGSLIRFAILQTGLWEELKKIVLEEGIILAGVIEEIKTSIVYEQLPEDEKSRFNVFYDKEALFNQLDFKEALEIHGMKEGKERHGLYSAFMRSSREPSVIGIDLLEEQKEEMGFILSLILAITDEHGRGVPLLLDYVDRESRITNKMIKELLGMYLEPKFYEKLFHSQRSKRIY